MLPGLLQELPAEVGQNLIVQVGLCTIGAAVMALACGGRAAFAGTARLALAATAGGCALGALALAATAGGCALGGGIVALGPLCSCSILPTSPEPGAFAKQSVTGFMNELPSIPSSRLLYRRVSQIEGQAASAPRVPVVQHVGHDQMLCGIVGLARRRMSRLQSKLAKVKSHCQSMN